MMDLDREARLRVPPPLVVSILWGTTPAILVLAAAVMFSRTWPWLGWVAFFGGVINMLIFSLVQLWSRRVKSWEMKAIPMSFAMLVLNGLLVFAGDFLLTLVFGPITQGPAGP